MTAFFQWRIAIPNSAVVPAGFSSVEPGVVPGQAVTLSWPTFYPVPRNERNRIAVEH